MDWLNTQTGGGYRLLTEVESEYVARGGAANAVYPWGNDPAKGVDSRTGSIKPRWRVQNDGHVRIQGLRPAGLHGRMAQHDACRLTQAERIRYLRHIGNISEWIEDCTYRRTKLSRGRRPPVVEGACAKRIAKGGSWGTLGNNLRTAERFPYAPTHRDDSIGIRVAKTLR